MSISLDKITSIPEVVAILNTQLLGIQSQIFIGNSVLYFEHESELTGLDIRCM